MRSTTICTIIALLLAAAPASADRTSLTDAPPIRRTLKYRASRHMVTPTFGFTVSDAFQRSLMVGLGYRYYLTNWLGLGLDFMATYLSLDTDLTEQIDSELSTPGNSAKPSTSGLGFLVGVGVTAVPLYGKMMLFGKFPAAYDVHVIAGAGFASTKGQGRIEGNGSFAPMWGVGARLFFMDWLAADVSFRDYIVKMPLVAPSSELDPEATWEQNFMVTVGVSFFFPPSLETEL